MLNIVMTVMNPTPPIWMSRMMTICPNSDQWIYVSYTISPVTQVALVAVKSESTKGVHTRSAEEIGRHKSSDPARMTTRYPNTRNLAAVSFLFDLIMVFPYKGSDAFFRGMYASALRSREANSPCAYLIYPSAAIMQALSVQYLFSGRTSFIFRLAASFASRSRR